VRTKKVVLNLDTRKKIHDTILAQPGICIRELERTINIALGELTYHIPILLKNKLIKEERDGYFRRFYPINLSKEEMFILSILRRDAVRRVIPILLKNRKVTNKILSNSLSITPSTASWHISRLKQNNLLIESKSKNKTEYSLRDKNAIERIYMR
jgi:predicted transcriptional regulator